MYHGLGGSRPDHRLHLDQNSAISTRYPETWYLKLSIISFQPLATSPDKQSLALEALAIMINQDLAVQISPSCFRQPLMPLSA